MAKQARHFLSVFGGLIVAMLCVGESRAADAFPKIYANKIIYDFAALVNCHEREGVKDIKSCLNFDDYMSQSQQKCADYGWPTSGPNACYGY
ncbi:MAG: hypothetical protein LBH81_00960 [Rickettsiales bacterium]|jgi:hypothetical protein|nr:hypothetical protein [Rickettsiales bacterium]